MVMVTSALPGLNNYMRLSSQSANRAQSTFNATQQTGSQGMAGLEESSTNSKAAQKRLEIYAAQNANRTTNSVNFNSATQAISTVSLGNNRTEMQAETAMSGGMAASSTSGTNSSSEVAQSASSGAASNQITSLSQQAMTTAQNEKTQTGQSSLQIQRTSAALGVYKQIGMGQSRAGINSLSGSTQSQGGASSVDSSQTSQGLQQMGIAALSMANQAPQQVLSMLR